MAGVSFPLAYSVALWWPFIPNPRSEQCRAPLAHCVLCVLIPAANWLTWLWFYSFFSICRVWTLPTAAGPLVFDYRDTLNQFATGILKSSFFPSSFVWPGLWFYCLCFLSVRPFSCLLNRSCTHYGLDHASIVHAHYEMWTTTTFSVIGSIHTQQVRPYPVVSRRPKQLSAIFSFRS
jgi:hypothetical protein